MFDGRPSPITTRVRLNLSQGKLLMSMPSISFLGRAAALCCAALFTSVSLGQTGVCCAPYLTCAIDTPYNCASMGGRYEGDNTTCSPVNPCTLPRGACCIVQSAVTPPPYTGGGGPVCVRPKFPRQGSRNGPTINSAPAPCRPACPPPRDEFAGPVLWENDPIICANLTELGCTSNGGTYHGNNTACTPTLCTPPAILPGACCILGPSGAAQCESRIEADCTIGTFTAGQSCTTFICPTAVLGACCRTDYCFTTSAINCNATGANYRGDGSTCAATCPPRVQGACCHAASADRGAWCNVVFNVGCTAAGDVFTAGQTCTSIAPCAGACPCDWNKDGFVNGYDLVAFTGDWLAGNGDFDGNSTTNNADYTAFSQCYSGPATAACIRR